MQHMTTLIVRLVAVTLMPLLILTVGASVIGGWLPGGGQFAYVTWVRAATEDDAFTGIVVVDVTNRVSSRIFDQSRLFPSNYAIGQLDWRNNGGLRLIYESRQTFSGAGESNGRDAGMLYLQHGQAWRQPVQTHLDTCEVISDTTSPSMPDSHDTNRFAAVCLQARSTLALAILQLTGGDAAIHWITLPEPQQIGNLSWSPDGTRLAFTMRPQSLNYSNLYVVSVDESGAPGDVRQLTNEVLLNNQMDWSPDGTQIALSARTSLNQYSHIFVIDTTVAGRIPYPKQLTDVPHNYEPRWSPDGGWIAFSSNRDGNREIYMVDSEGHESPRRLTSSPDIERSPFWSPDGRLLFTYESTTPSSRSNNRFILMNVHTGKLTNLARVGLQTHYITWRP